MRIGAIIPFIGKPHFLNDTVQNIGWVDKIVLMECYFSLYSDQSVARNNALKELPDCDYIFVLDSDEIILESDARNLLDIAKKSDELTFGARAVSYIKDFKHVIEYDSGHHPIVLVKRGVRLHDTRCYNRSFKKVSEVTLHHLKFLQPWHYIRFRQEQKNERRNIGNIKEVELNKELERAVKAQIHDNSKRVNYGEKF